MDEKDESAGGLAAGITAGLLFGLLLLSAALAYPVLWLVPAVAGVVWIIVNERRIKINNPSPTTPPPAQEGVKPVGEGVRPGIRRVDRIGGDAGYLIHPEPVPARDDERDESV